jgi:hypothetical protein
MTYRYLGLINRAEGELAYSAGDKKTAASKFNEALNIFKLRVKFSQE